MSPFSPTTVTTQLNGVLQEASDGPPPAFSYFSDRGPDAGIFGTIGPLSARQASAPSGKSGTSIAAHLHHLAFSLEASAGWIRGERPELDWDQSWRVSRVTDAEWAALKERLRQAFTGLAQAIEDHGCDSDEALGGALGAVAHTTYHLAVVRQKAAAM